MSDIDEGGKREFDSTTFTDEEVFMITTRKILSLDIDLEMKTEMFLGSIKGDKSLLDVLHILKETGELSEDAFNFITDRYFERLTNFEMENMQP